MRRITYLTLVLCCTLLAVPVVSGREASANGTQQPVAGPVHFYFCASNQIGVGHTAYISNIFAVSKQNSPPIESEYLGFLKKRYAYPANQTACFDGYLTQEAVRAARQTRIDQFGQIKDKVVETPWTYSAALSENEIHPQPTRVSSPPAPSSRVQEAAPEAAPAATAAQPPATAVAAPPRHVGTYLVYCSSRGTGPDVYVSDKFEVPPFEHSAKGTIQIAFHQFLHEKYSLPTDYQSGCGLDMGVGGRNVA